MLAFMFWVVSALSLLSFWMIASKAGFPGWISLAILVPVLNFVFLLYLAFAPWAALRHLPIPLPIAQMLPPPKL